MGPHQDAGTSSSNERTSAPPSIALELNSTNYFQIPIETVLPHVLPLGQPFINSKFDSRPSAYPLNPSATYVFPMTAEHPLKEIPKRNVPHGTLKISNLGHSQPRLPIKDPNLKVASFQEPAEKSKQESLDKKDESPQLVATEPSLGELAERIQGRIELINSNDTLDAAAKEEELTQLNLANQIVKEALAIQKEITDEEKRKETFSLDLKKLQEQLSNSPALNPPGSDLNSKQIETVLKQKKQKRDELKSKQSIIEDKIDELATQMATNPTLKTEILKELKETKEKFLESQATANNEDARLIFDAKKLKSNKQLVKISLDTIKQEQLGVLFPIQKQIIQRDIKNLESEISLWQKKFNQLQSLEISLQQAQAKQASVQAIQTDKTLAKIAEENQKITQLRSNIALDIEECNEKFTAADQEYEEINTDLESIKDKIEMPGGNRQDRGIELVKLSRNLMHTFESQTRIDLINEELRNCQLNELNLKAKLRVLAKRESQINRLLDERAKSGENGSDRLSTAEFTSLANELLDKQHKYSSDLLLDYQKLRNGLVHERERLIQLINKVNEAREYSAKNALWVRSANPMSFSDFKSAWTSVQLFFSPQQWLDLGTIVSTNIKKRPYGTLFAGFLILCAFVFSRRLRGDV